MHTIIFSDINNNHGQREVGLKRIMKQEELYKTVSSEYQRKFHIILQIC